MARAFFLGLGVHSVIVIDEDWEEMMIATCRGAGLAPMPFPADGVHQRESIICVPCSSARCLKTRKAASVSPDDLLERTKPSVMISH
ncbi:hypothetical protein ACFFYR_18420 [Paraburkholderia dipogonis]|uniref:hypothetical protein n=1 Tax=Paraburkholderia dipogonis TaxID=1211383 RepID=UPI0035E4D6A1